MTEPILSFYQVLFAVAWSDGRLGEREAHVLRRLLSISPPGAEHTTTIRGWFDEAPPAPDWPAARADASLREALMREVMAVAAADGTVKLEEMRFVEGLRERLEMDDAELHRIQVEVEARRAAGG